MTDYHHAEKITISPEGRNRDGHQDELTVYAIAKDDGIGHGGLRISGAYPSSIAVTVGLTLDDLDALRHAITRLLVKVQAEADTPPTASVDIPAAAVGMVAGIPTPSVSVG